MRKEFPEFLDAIRTDGQFSLYIHCVSTANGFTEIQLN